MWNRIVLTGKAAEHGLSADSQGDGEPLRLRPPYECPIRDRRNSTRKMRKRVCAILEAAPAIPLKPQRAATMATRKNATAQ
jgi:hypothetical protein